METTKQQRDTKQRREVYDAVMSRCDHPSADEIYLSLRAVDDKISRGTVFRNLKLLADNNEIMYVRVPGADRYDSRLENHYHIICIKCGKVEDAPTCYNYDYDSQIAEKTGYNIVRHRTIFESICPDCINRRKK